MSHFRYLFALLIWPVWAFGQVAIVERNVNLRPDPSTDQAPITKLTPETSLQLLEPATHLGYYHVRTSVGDEGWVWAHNVRVEAAGQPPLPSAPGVATAIDASWDKPVPDETSIDGDEGSCGPTGDGGDRPTNRLKNRSDVPAAYHPVTFQAIAGRSYPSPAPLERRNWTQDQLSQITPFEGAAVSVEGYVVAIRAQTGGSGETTNCHFHHAAAVDWHIALVEHPGDPEGTAIVVETTPRVRRLHAGWTTKRLGMWKNSNQPVRISGWLMFDPSHPNHLGRYRSTLWEVHPITKIELFDGSEWEELDDIP